MLNWSEYLGQKYQHTQVEFLHLGGSYSSEEIDRQAKGLFQSVKTEYLGVEGDKVYTGIGGAFIGNNPNAMKNKGLSMLDAHTKAVQNIGNLKYVYRMEIEKELEKWRKTEKVLNAIYSNQGIRIFNTVGKDKNEK